MKELFLDPAWTIFVGVLVWLAVEIVHEHRRAKRTQRRGMR
jgi:hypothetical protein